MKRCLPNKNVTEHVPQKETSVRGKWLRGGVVQWEIQGF